MLASRLTAVVHLQPLELCPGSEVKTVVVPACWRHTPAAEAAFVARGRSSLLGRAPVRDIAIEKYDEIFRESKNKEILKTRPEQTVNPLGRVYFAKLLSEIRRSVKGDGKSGTDIQREKDLDEDMLRQAIKLDLAGI
jgi:hypothetical protein